MPTDWETALDIWEEKQEKKEEGEKKIPEAEEIEMEAKETKYKTPSQALRGIDIESRQFMTPETLGDAIVYNTRLLQQLEKQTRGTDERIKWRHLWNQWVDVVKRIITAIEEEQRGRELELGEAADVLEQAPLDTLFSPTDEEKLYKVLPVLKEFLGEETRR